MMHYLRCIAMLDYLQKKLCNEQRKQVPVSTMDEVLNVVDKIRKELPQETDAMLEVRLQDAQTAALSVKGTQGILYLPNEVKEAITAGLEEVREALHLCTFRYYADHDFEPTDEIVQVMREVVKTALRNGLIPKGK